MNDDRTEAAVQRIEAALARIAECADAPMNGGPPAANNGTVPDASAVAALIERHETLRETVDHTLSDLDDLLAKIDR